MADNNEKVSYGFADNFGLQARLGKILFLASKPAIRKFLNVLQEIKPSTSKVSMNLKNK
jgi:uncharacterized Fe-S cluster-containing MiaB family protein